MDKPLRPLLVLDTSTDRTIVALALADGTAQMAPVDAARRHGLGLLPAIRDLLAEYRLKPADLALIAVGVGPGSFTGLRIGLTAAKMLSYVGKTRLLGLDSLETIARNAPAEALRIVVAVDAQRNEVYTAEFRREPGSPALIRVRPTAIEPIETWQVRLTPNHFVMGPALERLRVDWPSGIQLSSAESGSPDGRHLIALADDTAASGRDDDPWTLEPVYLRRSAAEEKRAAE